MILREIILKIVDNQKMSVNVKTPDKFAKNEAFGISLHCIS